MVAKFDELGGKEGCVNGLSQQKCVTWLYMFGNMFVKSNFPHFFSLPSKFKLSHTSWKTIQFLVYDICDSAW